MSATPRHASPRLTTACDRLPVLVVCPVWSLQTPSTKLSWTFRNRGGVLRSEDAVMFPTEKVEPAARRSSHQKKEKKEQLQVWHVFYPKPIWFNRSHRWIHPPSNVSMRRWISRLGEKKVNGHRNRPKKNIWSRPRIMLPAWVVLHGMKQYG
jgi:hypothetical protein